MYRSFLKFLMITISAMIITASPVNACTVFRITDGENVLFGNNEDWFDNDTYIWFIPGDQDKHGRAYFGFQNAYPQGGLNDQGLAFDWFASGAGLAPSDPAKPDFPGSINDALMEKCSTVEEAITLFETYNCRDLGYAEILLADKTGASASITWDWNNKKVSVKRTGDACQVIGSGASGSSRQFDAYRIVNLITAREMLRAASNDNTLYSGIYDLNNGAMTVYKQRDYKNAVTFDLDEELQKGKHLYYIQDLFGGPKKNSPDQIKPLMLLAKGELALLIVLSAIYSISALIWMIRLISAKNKKRAETLFMAAGVLNAALVVAEAGILFFLGSFVAKYGASLAGWLPASIPCAILVLSFVQLILLPPVLKFKGIKPGYRIHHAFLVIINCLTVLALILNKLIFS